MHPHPRNALLAIALLFLHPALAPAAPSQTGTARLMQGPMLGPVTPTTAIIWARASGPYELTLACGKEESLENATQTSPVKASIEDDLIVTLPIEGLEPNTTYYYRVLLDGEPDRYRRDAPASTFTTAPEGPAEFSVAFGSCARVQEDTAQPIWNVVAQLQPDLFFWIGDNIYGDSLAPQILAEEYQRQREIASIQPVLANIPQLAVWDDHDFGLNDHDRTNPVKEAALDVFKDYWPNPGYGLDNTPGVFFAYTYGGVDFLFLDGRYHRDPNADPGTPDKTFLGQAQRDWLRQQLKQSQAPFKVLVCGSGWTAAKGEGGDSWAAFLHERDALFEFIRENNISGVVLLSGDTHTGELNAIPWSEKGGYDLYDLVSSPLAQNASKGWRERTPEVRLRPGFEQPNAGLITFNMTHTPPTLTFNLYDPHGNEAWEPFTLSADELKNGVTSHKSKDTYEE